LRKGGAGLSESRRRERSRGLDERPTQAVTKSHKMGRRLIGCDQHREIERRRLLPLERPPLNSKKEMRREIGLPPRTPGVWEKGRRELFTTSGLGKGKTTVLIKGRKEQWDDGGEIGSTGSGDDACLSGGVTRAGQERALRREESLERRTQG